MISLAQTAILLAAAVVAVSLFRFARLSSILGYLVAGLVIGPWGLNLIGDVGRILQVSEFGIVLLLFIIGLELQPTSVCPRPRASAQIPPKARNFIDTPARCSKRRPGMNTRGCPC